MKEKWNKVKSMVREWWIDLWDDLSTLYDDHPIVYFFMFYCVGFFIGFMKLAIKVSWKTRKGGNV